jgi:hypothetical protein
MKTAIQELIHFIENDRMQSIYTKEQVLELLNFKLEKEKEQIRKAYSKGYNESSWGRFSDSEKYYNETFKSE